MPALFGVAAPLSIEPVVHFPAVLGGYVLRPRWLGSIPRRRFHFGLANREQEPTPMPEFELAWSPGASGAQNSESPRLRESLEPGYSGVYLRIAIHAACVASRPLNPWTRILATPGSWRNARWKSDVSHLMDTSGNRSIPLMTACSHLVRHYLKCSF